MTTYLQTLMHLVKGIIGAGIFSMGVAFKNAGMIVALIITPIMGIIVCHCATLLVRVVEFLEAQEEEEERKREKENSDELKPSGRRSYAEITEKIFHKGGPLANRMARAMKIFVNIGLCTMNLGFCITYVVFLGANMDKALSFFGVNIEIHLIMLICIVPMWLLSLITKLEVLAPFSMFANALLVCIIGATLYFICQDLPSFSTTKYTGDIATLPVVPLRSAMKRPERFVGTFGVLNVGFFVITPFIVVMGTMAYLKYGEEISGTVFINLPETTSVEVLIILVCIQVILTYPIQIYVPVAVLWPLITDRFGPFKRPLLTLLCFRTSLVAFTLLIGQVIPFIHLIMSLVGAICSTSLTLFIPPFLDMVTFYPRERSSLKRTFQATKNSILFVLAIVIFISGIYASVRDIIAEFQNEE